MRKWEKFLPFIHDGDSGYKATIEEESSTVRGTTYQYACNRVYSDGSIDSQILLSGWHDTLQGAKRSVDKEYDIDPNIKTKWKQIKN